MAEVLRFEVEEDFHKWRLDLFLYDKIPVLSKMFLRELIAEGTCRVNGKFEPPGTHLFKSDIVELEVDLNAETSMLPEDLPIEVVFEDEDIIVVNKAAGMLVHPTKGVRRGTLLNALTHHLNYKDRKEGQKIIRPGLIHRLDRQTSGLMVIAKNPRAHRLIAGHFQRRLIEKKYLAVVSGVTEDSGVIRSNISRNAEEQFWYATDDITDGKPAETRFQKIKNNADYTLLELEPYTGRTNQLRLHCSNIKHPIVGDSIYGGQEFSRLCLHAAKLSFHHPTDNRLLIFEAKPDDSFESFFQ